MDNLLKFFAFCSTIIVSFCQVNITINVAGNSVLLEENQVVNVIEGEVFQFTCQTDRNVIIGLTTAPMDAIADTFSGSGTKTRNFTRSNISRNISGTVFTCSDLQDTNSFTLDVLYQPEYSFPMLSYTAKENDMFTNTATLDSNPNVTESDTTWTNNGLVVTESSRIQLSTTTITITSVSRDDSGMYVLEGNNTVGFGNASFNLEVYFGPDFTNNGGNIEVTVGESLSIDCSVSASGSNPAVQSVTISGYDITGVMNVPDNGGSRVFTVTDSVTSNFNNQMYTCSASNGETMMSITYTVTVIQPTLSSTSISLMPSSSSMSTPIPSSRDTTPNPTGEPDPDTGALSTGAIAGIAVAAIVFGLILIIIGVVLLVFVIMKMRGSAKA